MYRLVKINLKEFEIWSEAQYSTMIRKCEYYGAKPFWKEIKKFESNSVSENYSWEPGEIVPYVIKDRTQRLAIITELLNFDGVRLFKGLDLVSKLPILYPIPKLS